MNRLPLPKGYKIGVVAAGFRKADKWDLSLVVSDTPAVAAGVFTTNLFQAAPVLVGRELLQSGKPMRAVLVNTGQANACTGEEGLANCQKTLQMVGAAAGMPAEAILPGSTGVIGNQIRMDVFEKAIPGLVDNIGKHGLEDLALAMTTTDRFPKYAAATCEIDGVTVTISGAAKGAGMICPNMATMLSTVLCDAKVNAKDWQTLFRRAVDQTFNRVSVDGDTSTNDTLYGLANGAAGVLVAGENLAVLEAALVDVLGQLAYKLVEDGEGATKVMRITVKGAANTADAEKIARSVGHSQLVKTAMYGKDANWGRIVCAVGYAGVTLDPKAVRLSLCGVELFKNGQPADTDFETLLKEPLQQRDIAMDIVVGKGAGEYTFLASDLGHEYVNINAEYRS